MRGAGQAERDIRAPPDCRGAWRWRPPEAGTGSDVTGANESPSALRVGGSERARSRPSTPHLGDVWPLSG